MSNKSPSLNDLYTTLDLKQLDTSTSTYAVVNKATKTEITVNDGYNEASDNTIQVTQDERSETVEFQNNADNNCFSLVNFRFKINIAFALSLFAGIAIGIITALVIFVFVKVYNTEKSLVMSPISNNMENQLKSLEENIQNLNQTVQNTKLLLQSNSSQNQLTLSSCLIAKDLKLPSGSYSLPSPTGEQTRLYCDMDLTCGNITGGWMRVADLDLYNCPPGLRSQIIQGNKACIRDEYRQGCTPVLYNTFGIPYSKICGIITGYGVNTPDGFRTSFPADVNVNNDYVDGIIVQSGANHIWTYVAGGCEQCNARKPNFIGGDWICDGRSCSHNSYCDGPLWDAPICGSSNPFYKHMSSSSTADIEMRVCRDDDRNDEDIAITELKFYVQ